MAKILRSLFTVGAGALIYKALTKKDMLTDENVRNGTIGAVSGMIGIPEIEKIVTGKLPDDKGKNLRDALLYGVVGAGIGYVVSSGKHKKVVDYARNAYEKYLSPEDTQADDSQS